MADLIPKKQMSLQEKLKAIDNVAEVINKKAGKTIMGRIAANPEILEKLTIKFIPMPSMSVNEAVGGGFPKGKMSIVAGKPDSGKTSLLLETIAENMKADPNFVAAWIESENSFNKEYACKTFGIDPERFVFVEHERKGGGEAVLDTAETVLATGAIDIFVINSLKAIVPTEEFKKSLGDAVVGTQARMNARMVRKFTALIAEHDTAFVIITHLTVDIGSMSRDPLIISGGNAIAFQSMLTLDIRKQSLGDGDPITKEEGIKIGVTVKKNHCMPDRNPYVKTEYYAVFGQGTEKYLELLTLATDQEILTKRGSWIYDIDPATNEPKMLGDEKLAWIGKASFREFCKSHPAYFEELKSRVKGEVKQLTSEEITAIEKDNKDIENSVPDDIKDEVKKTKSKGKKGE
jgi:recombination protein RecA